jgi:plasmid stabilization system protein ParE
MRNYRVDYHPLVERDLERIALFLLDYTTLASVAGKLFRVRTDMRALAIRPHRGTRYDDILPELRAVPSSDKGVIAFTVDEDTRIVRVLCVTWGGANWMATVGDRA